MLTHTAGGAVVNTYDFDGRPARIYKIRQSMTREPGLWVNADITVPGSPIQRLLTLTGENVATGTDGETLTGELNMCLDVPAGTVLQWDSQAGSYLLVLFELMGD